MTAEYGFYTENHKSITHLSGKVIDQSSFLHLNFIYFSTYLYENVASVHGEVHFLDMLAYCTSTVLNMQTLFYENGFFNKFWNIYANLVSHQWH